MYLWSFLGVGTVCVTASALKNIKYPSNNDMFSGIGTILMFGVAVIQAFIYMCVQNELLQVEVSDMYMYVVMISALVAAIFNMCCTTVENKILHWLAFVITGIAAAIMVFGKTIFP